MARKTIIMVSSSYRTIAMMTVITSVMWTAFGIYNTVKKPVDLEISPAILAPVNASIDMETLEKLKTRRQMSDEVTSNELVQAALAILLIEPGQQVASESAETTVVETPTETPSPSLSPTPTPTSEQLGTGEEVINQ